MKNITLRSLVAQVMIWISNLWGYCNASNDLEETQVTPTEQ